MGAATSKDIAAATLVLLGFDIITLAMRFWVRIQRAAWGPDDWAMVATIVCLTEQRFREAALLTNTASVGRITSWPDWHGLEWSWAT